MHNCSQGSRAAWARGFAARVVLAMVVAVSARPAEAAPFAYLTRSNAVSVIDTATNEVVATIPVGGSGQAAVTPDGKRVYVPVPAFVGTVAVIDTASNKVVATVPAGTFPNGIAVTPDGKHAYVGHDYEHGGCNMRVCSQNVSVIDTATNTNRPKS